MNTHDEVAKRKQETLEQLVEEFSMYSETYEILHRTDFKFIPEFVECDLDAYFFVYNGTLDELLSNIKVNSDYAFNMIKALLTKKSQEI